MVSKQSRRIERVSDAALLILFFFLVNLRAFVFWEMLPDVTDPSGPVPLEVALWIMLVLLVVGRLAVSGGTRAYFLRGQRNLVLIAFVALCCASVFWSISPAHTIYRAFTLACATAVAIYLALRYDLSSWLEILRRFGGLLLVAGYGFIVLLPQVGTDLHLPYDGAWRGVFWHKNHLGAVAPIMATVFLLQLLSGSRRWRSPDLVGYLASLVMITFAKSAAGYILTVALHLITAAILLWIKARPRLRPRHYYAFAVALVAMVTLAGLNLDAFLGAFGRDTSLTGRLPLWAHLWQDWISQRPWLGYGFGAVWMLDWFRTGLQDLLGWGYPVKIGDNGFLDILLHVGGVGLALLIGILIQATVRAVRTLRRDGTLESAFPLIFVCYLLIANISFSLLLETESLTWSILVVNLCMFDARGNPASATLQDPHAPVSHPAGRRLQPVGSRKTA